MAELGQTHEPRELIEGVPAVIEDTARVLERRAKHAVDVAVSLRAIDTGVWSGPAAEAFRNRFSYEPTKWYDVGDALDASAQVLDCFAATLRWAQSQATEAIALWDQGQAHTERAEAEHAAAVAEANQRNDANAAAGNPARITVAAFADPGEATRQAARDTLNRARDQLRQVGDDSADALRQFTPPEPESTFAQLAHLALDVAGFVPGIGEAADLTNAAWYAAQGKTVEAGLSAAAAIPFLGWAAGAGKITKAVGKFADAAKAAGHAPAQFGRAIRKDYRKTFLEAHPELRGKVVVHHAVERQAATRYPGADISLAEMHSLDNLRGIPKEHNRTLHLKEIRAEWKSFYQSHPEATKEELLDFATHVDTKYGHRFNPPIR